MKYQRLSVLVRQLAAVIINTTPGVEEPVKPTDIFITAFDDFEPATPHEAIPTDEWELEKQRIEKLMNNGKS
jgi:hypothetical protein